MLSYQLGHRCTEDGCALKSAATTREGRSGKAFGCATLITAQVTAVRHTPVINEGRWFVRLLAHSRERIHGFWTQPKMW